MSRSCIIAAHQCCCIPADALLHGPCTEAPRCALGMLVTMALLAGQVDMDTESLDNDSLLHREQFGHGHEARVAAGKKVRVVLRR
jgi:hypothetical protein